MTRSTCNYILGIKFSWGKLHLNPPKRLSSRLWMIADVTLGREENSWWDIAHCRASFQRMPCLSQHARKSQVKRRISVSFSFAGDWTTWAWIHMKHNLSVECLCTAFVQVKSWWYNEDDLSTTFIYSLSSISEDNCLKT